jgi:hypothetical protein
MRHVLALAIAWLAGVASVSAQGPQRLEAAAIVRTDRVSFEGGQHTQLPVAGVGIAYRVWKDMRVEGEITMASGESRRSHEGDFISFAGPNATREEFLQMAVIARRTTVNRPGLGVATAVAVETRQPGRVNIGLRAGISFRQYDYIEDTTVLRVPEGVTFDRAESAMPDTRGTRGRGGLLFGASVPVRVAGRFYIAPDVRWVWGGPARVGNNYDEATIGARGVWKF